VEAIRLMELSKEQLEEKLKLFTNKYNELNKVIEDNIALSRKLEGAIEVLQVLLVELQNKTNTEKDVN
jgi:hypothetical protein